MPCRIEPGPFNDANCVNDQLVYFPMPDGVTHPFRVFVDFFGMLCAVEVNDPEDALVFEQNGDDIVVLHELKRRRTLKSASGTNGEAEAVRIVRRIDLVESFGSIRSEGNGLTG